jgi:predicted transcriptional regulator
LLRLTCASRRSTTTTVRESALSKAWGTEENETVDVNALIDAVVRQTTVLIAQLATAAGGRAPLVNTANQVFVDLVRELREQGVGNKVIADMFGLALRTYHDKVRRLSESTTFRGKSLWEATLDFIRKEETILQTDVLERFRNDDEATVRGVLTDLVESGLVFRSGRGARTTYRAAGLEELALAEKDDKGESAMNLVWVAVSRLGSATTETIAQAVALDALAIDTALERLVQDGRVARVERAGAFEYRTDLCVIPYGTLHGWEAAVFDHYQAVVTAICTKLRTGTTSASAADRIGGSTYGFKVWEGHPHFDEVTGLLRRMRTDAIALREKVTAFNAEHTAPAEALRVISYMGQTILESDLTPEHEI